MCGFSSTESDPPQQGYVDKQLNLLGDRDPLSVLSQTPSALCRIVEAHSADALRTRPFEGKWSPVEIIGHLVDCEWIFGFRVRHILCEDQPLLLSFDQEAWVRGHGHAVKEPRQLVDQFCALRPLNLETWRNLGPADLERVGRYADRGAESIGFMMRLQASHDLSHLDQIDRFLAAIESAAS